MVQKSFDYLSAVENSRVLAIESSCDDTSAAVLVGHRVRSNIAASQEIHEKYGGVVPELASREHQRQIVPIVQAAIEKGGVDVKSLSAIAYTSGPGLLGSLHVGAAFAKSLSIAWQLPLVEVHHMHAHILAHFIDDPKNEGGIPELPFLCLTVSGGHTQLVFVQDPLSMKVIGQTIDDAAGEAFDKIAKLMGLPYPGGPLIDELAQQGDPHRFKFSKPQASGLDYSFSGLKTAVLYFLRKAISENQDFIELNKADLAASVQHTIIEILIKQCDVAIKQTGVTSIALAGGVSANSGLRKAMKKLANDRGVSVHIPSFAYCTDNAAMIGMAAQFKLAAGDTGALSTPPSARLAF